MLASLARAFPHLVAETVPARVSALVLADVLRRLVTEHVSIRNLRRILMAVGTWAPREPDPVYLTEYVRAALQREISHRVARGQRRLFVFLLDPTIEAEIRDAIRHTGTGSYVALEPARLRTIVDAISVPTRELAAQGAQLQSSPRWKFALASGGW